MKWINNGKIKAIKVVKVYRIPKEEIDRLIDKQRKEDEMFFTKEEAIKSGASEEFVNAKPIMCDTCLNGWVRISENGYSATCTLSQKKAINCLTGVKSHYVERQDMRKEDEGK